MSQLKDLLEVVGLLSLIPFAVFMVVLPFLIIYFLLFLPSLEILKGLGYEWVIPHYTLIVVGLTLFWTVRAGNRFHTTLEKKRKTTLEEKSL